MVFIQQMTDMELNMDHKNITAHADTSLLTEFPDQRATLTIGSNAWVLMLKESRRAKTSRTDLSLARLDNVPEGKLVSYIQAHSLFRAEPVPVEHFTLFSSQLGKEASVYTAEVEYGLSQVAPNR